MQNNHQFILSFEKKLAAINADDITDQPYCKKYFLHLLQNKRYYLTIYTHVLKLLLVHSRLKKEELVVVDYGAGNGLLGLFAKHCGFNKVYINDLDENFLKAAEKLSLLLNIKINGLIKGDIDNVSNALASEPPQAIIGTDVIEHIYNLDVFFSQLQQLNPGITSVFTTGSNTANLYKTRRLKKLQLKDEYKGWLPGEEGIFLGDGSADSFENSRRKIIDEYFVSLSAAEKEQLVIHTRGLIKADILLAGQKYLQDKILPPLLKHPTNTCDPLSGSWTERLLTIDEYKFIYDNAAFKLKVYNGFYNQYSMSFKSKLMKVANICIKIFGKRVSPFIFLAGTGNNK